MQMRWLFGRSNVRAPWIVAILVLINALVLRALDPLELSALRNMAFDAFQRLQPRPYNPQTPVRIVDLDEASLAEFGQWPWPRTIVARLVDKLTEKGAVVIAFDILFAEPDRASISRLLRDLVGVRDLQFAERFAEEVRDNDEVLAEAMARSAVVLGLGFDPKGASRPPRRHYGVAFAGDDPSQFLRRQRGAVTSLPLFEAVAKGNGSINTGLESDIIRRVPMMFRLANQEGLYPALSIEALRVAQGATTYVIKSSGASSELSFGAKTGIVAIRTGNIEALTDGQGRLVVWDTGYLPARYLSARAVLKDEVPADKLDGHVVFIGTSALGLKDVRYTPVGGAVPGVDVHAQLAEQMIERQFLARPDYTTGAEFLYLGAIGLLFIFLMPRLSAGRMAIVAAVFIVIGVAAPWLAYSQLAILFDPIYPPVTLAVIYISGTALSFMRAERERTEIRGAFSHYLSPDVVEQLARNPELLHLGGESREITIMFTDMRGFTRISEQFDPQGLIRFMNRFLTPMTDLILSHRGTIDKYMGDAIMAFWNAPVIVEHHAAQACDTALAMQARLRALNEEWKAEAESTGRTYIPVRIGIGLNTGLASVGNIGSEQRFTYSCLSDDVNLASRLEGQCKTYAVDIIIGDKTRLQAPDRASLELDMVMVKGRTEPERIHALLGDAVLARSPAFQSLVHEQEAFLGAYRAGRFDEAREMIARCKVAADAAGWRQGYYDAMLARVDALILDPPSDWTGVFVAREK